MIPEFVAGLYAGKGSSMMVALVAALAALVLAEVAVLALKRQAQAKACAEKAAQQARENDERARGRAKNLARILEVSNNINATLELEPLLNRIVEAVRESLGFRMVLLRMASYKTLQVSSAVLINLMVIMIILTLVGMIFHRHGPQNSG